jgi:hypothetical protein
VLQLLETLGLDRGLFPYLSGRRDRFWDDAPKSPGAPKVGTQERRRRATIAGALSMLMAHGWEERKAAEQVAEELKSLGASVPAKDVIEHRRDLRHRDYTRAAKATKPLAWTDAIAKVDRGSLENSVPKVVGDRRTEQTRQAWGLPAAAGIAEFPEPQELAQRYFDQLMSLAEPFYACRLDDGRRPEKVAALEAARWILKQSRISLVPPPGRRSPVHIVRPKRPAPSQNPGKGTY